MVGAVEVDTDAALGDACEVLHSLHERCMRRETLQDGDSPEDLEWSRTPDGMYVMPVREGFLMKYWDHSMWCLVMSWKHGYGARLVVRASLVTLERYARDIQRYGPTGGPDYTGGPLRWVRFDDATWHAAALNGELRLMPLEEEDGEHLLLHARNDLSGSVAVLGSGDREELQDVAEQGGDEAAENPLRIVLDGRPRLLRCVGAERILGVLEHGDERFVLGHLGGELFGLVGHVRDEIHHFRIYTLAELRRGDLGPAVPWDPQSPTATTEPRATSTETPPAPPTKSEPTTPRRLQGLELQHVLAHLAPTAPPTGPGSSILSFVFAGIRALVPRGLSNQVLWASELQDLLVRRAGVRVHCCMKTFNLALRAVAAHTPLLVRQKRRWLLRLGELLDPGSELLESIVRASPLRLDDLDEEPEPIDTKCASRRGPLLEQPNPAPQSGARHESPRPDSAASAPDDVGVLKSAQPGVSLDAPTGDGGDQCGQTEPLKAAPPSRGSAPHPLSSSFVSPLAVAAGVLPGVPKFMESQQSFRDWLNVNMQRLAQSRESTRAPPKRAAQEGTRSTARREGQPVRWTRRRR